MSQPAVENEKIMGSKSGFGWSVGVVVSPKEAFEGMLKEPKIFFPFCMSVLGIPLLYLSRYPLYLEMIRRSAEASMALQNQVLSPEQMDMALKIGTVTGLIGAPIFALVSWLMFSAVLFGLVKAFKGEGRFKQYLAIVGYAYVIRILYFVVCGVVSFLSGQLLLDASLGLAVPSMKGEYVYGILRSIDLFTVWYFLVVAIGTSVVSKLSNAKVYSMVSLVFAASVLFSAVSNRSL